MLTLGKVRRGRLGYYLDRAGGSAPGSEAPGRFAGSLAEGLGLGLFPVDHRTLPALLEGVDPLTGELLDARHQRVRVLAYDCTFSAPKSVSLLSFLSPPEVAEQVRAAHGESVLAALGYLEERAALVSRSVGGRTRAVPADGLAAALFVHRTSRAGDPHLHTHTLVANLARDGEGVYSALDGRGLFEQAATAGSLFRSQLRHELHERLGIRFERGRGGFGDVSGFSRRVVGAFSKRRAEILDACGDLPRPSARARRLAADRTRPAQPREDFATLCDLWRTEAHRLGLDDSRFVPGDRGARAPLLDHTLVADRDELSEAARQAVLHIDGPFSRSTAIRTVAAALDGGAPVRALEGAVDEALTGTIALGRQSRGLTAGDGSAIPPAISESLFVSPASAAVLEAVASACAAAPCLEELAGSAPSALSGGLFVARSPQLLEDLVRLESVVARARRERTAVVALGPSAPVRAHLEAVTAARPLSSAEIPALRSGLLVVSGMDRLAPSNQRHLLALARSGRATVVALGGSGPRRAIGPEPGPGQRAWRETLVQRGVEERVEALSLSTVDGPIEVRICSGVTDAIAALAREAEVCRASDSPVALVLGDPELAGLLGPPALGPRQVPAFVRNAPAGRLAVLGGPAVLGRLASTGNRVHVFSIGREGAEVGREAVLASLSGPGARGRLRQRPPRRRAQQVGNEPLLGRERVGLLDPRRAPSIGLSR